MSFLTKIFGDDSSRFLKESKPTVEKINSLEGEFSSLSDEKLKIKTEEFKERVRRGESLDEILPEAFALVREAAKRTLNQRHFDVQIIGGLVLHRGNISEMRTGEGKTLVATLPAYLNALMGKGVHIITVNDYLAKRDAVWMGQIYYALGLKVGVVAHDSSFIYDPKHTEKDKERDEKGSYHIVDEFLNPCSRTQAYGADITYGTNSEFGFDYLRDNLEYDKKNLRQMNHSYAIVDEIDSILIDEARTPLIISAPAEDSEDFYKKFAGISLNFIEDKDYTVDEKVKAILLTDQGIEKAEKALGVSNIYTEGGVKMVHHLETAVRAKALFHKDKEYVVRDNEVVIVDSFTGRLQPGRRWSEGLHQAIEAKEGVVVQKESRTYASITYQNYFRMYKKLSGMTGTAATSAEEFYKVYGLNTIVVPTNKDIARIDRGDLIFQTEKGKFKAIARKVKELNQKEQPVLIGTVSIEKNELLSVYLSKEGVKHEVLNAKNHQREGEIIAQAGRVGAVTIATNMAGRGVDIKLGGNPQPEGHYQRVKNSGGLFVLGTERHDARRIDNQLRGRSGRQGDPGETQFFVSLEDSLMRVFAADTIKKMMGRLGIAEDEPIENRIITKSLESAQEKIEGLNFDSRKHILEFDDVLNYQRTTFYNRRRETLLGTKEFLKSYLNKILSESSDQERSVVNKKIEEVGEDNFLNAFQRLSLNTFDMFWIDHLETMDYMRSSVNLRAYGQRDPLTEYKREGLKLFKEMESSIEKHIIKNIQHISPAVEVKESIRAEVERQATKITTTTSNSELSSSAKSPDGKKLGRNDPCWCGSGKKFKKCHGANA